MSPSQIDQYWNSFAGIHPYMHGDSAYRVLAAKYCLDVVREVVGGICHTLSVPKASSCASSYASQLADVWSW